MPSFQGLPRAVLQAISNVSGESYRDVDGTELVAELARLGFEPDNITLYNLMFRLRDNGGYLEFYAGGGMELANMGLIRLSEPGRQEVEGWPVTPGAVSGADVETLLSVLEARSQDTDVPEPERRKAKAALGALRELGVQVTGEIVTTWLRHLGVG
jgi:hypothetical protein